MLDGIYTNTAILWLLLEVIPGIKIDKYKTITKK